MKGFDGDTIHAVIVEDEPKIGMYIKDKIEALDVTIRVEAVAENGKEALQIIKEKQPQVVFTDISMPVLDGLELAKIVKSTYPGILVVIISGYSDFSYAQQALRYGVFDYLLKPLEDEKLQELLFDIHKTLFYAKVKQQRQVIHSDGYLFQQSDEVRYALFSICVGNILYDVQDLQLLEYYREPVNQIPWNTLMENICKDYGSWYLVDEQAVNQKILGIQILGQEEVSLPAVARQVKDAVSEHTDMAVHVACYRELIPYEELWNAARYLRYQLSRELIVGKSQILTDGEVRNKGQDMIEIVKMKINNYIRNYFLSTDLKNFAEEIRTTLKYMILNQATQAAIEKVSLYVLKSLEFCQEDYDEIFVEKKRVALQRCIGLSQTEDELMSRMMEEFTEISEFMKTLHEKSEETRVHEYIDKHFLTLESLGQVADAFGYNYAYLSRLLKKTLGMPVNQYITEKKIKLAMELVDENPDMSQDEISELCGYKDSRYFGRVFKNQTGVSFREYRAKKD